VNNGIRALFGLKGQGLPLIDPKKKLFSGIDLDYFEGHVGP